MYSSVQTTHADMLGHMLTLTLRHAKKHAKYARSGYYTTPADYGKAVKI